jgi:hypothetical protein
MNDYHNNTLLYNVRTEVYYLRTVFLTILIELYLTLHLQARTVLIQHNTVFSVGIIPRALIGYFRDLH